MMSRRGGKRRQVLQLGDTSKLHRYGYSKGFQSVDSSVQSNTLTGLVGDYSDSDSDENSNGEQKVENVVPERDEPHDDTSLPAVTVTDSKEQNEDHQKEDPLDNELRNFLSEIEAIPMPDESKTPDRLSEGGISPVPTNQTTAMERVQGIETVEDVQSSNKIAPDVSKKKNTYSMFVKGDVEFTHSPSPTPANSEQASEDPEEKTKSTNTIAKDSNSVDVPEEPKTCWQMVQDETTQYYYYWNWQTNEVTWEIPSDYTQYLLLHKEYEEKIAKIPSHVLQALKDKKRGKDKSIDDSNVKQTNVAPVGSVATHSRTHPTGKEKAGDDGFTHHHHHKKKKSKKSKKKYNSSSDEDLDNKYLQDDPSSRKSLPKNKKSKTTIGPQPLSIVPYMSDDNDEDSCNDNDEIGEKGEKVIVTDSISCLKPPAVLKDQSIESRSASISPVCVPKSVGPDDIKDTETDFDSLVQNLVEFHDNMNLSEENCDTKFNKRKVANIKEVTLGKDGNKAETGENKHDALSDNVDMQEKGDNAAQVDLIKNEFLNDEEVSVKQENETSPKEKERQNIFDQFSVKSESEKKSKKKKVINMFAEDSQSEIDESVDADDKDSHKEMLKVPKNVEMEEGEVSNSSEFLSKIIESKVSHVKEEQKRRSELDTGPHAQGSEIQDCSLKSIVGYSEEDEKEEGEWKEDEKVKDKEEMTDDHLNQPKKKILQYKDYMKKYRSASKDEESSEKEVITSSSTTNSDGPIKSHEEKDTVKEEDAIEPIASHVEEKIVKEDVDEKGLDTGDDVDSEEDIDFDDLDNIDRVLEKALEKKREHKTAPSLENKPENDEKADNLPETSHATSSSSSSIETKQTEVLSVIEKGSLDTVEPSVEPSVEGSAMSDTDMKRLKYSVKDSAELALNKLQFLDISTKNLSKLQILLVELQTRYNDWQSGGLVTPYFHKQLKSSEALLSQYEESAVPSGWLCQWDRASCRYFYRNQQSGHTQWEYPQVVGGAEPTTTSTSKSGEPKDSVSSRGRSSKKRRSKDIEEKEDISKTRGHTASSRSSRSHRSSKKGSEKDRGKRDRHSSSSHHHRKKKRRRRDHSSSSSSSEDEGNHSRHRHRSKRKKRGRSDKSPSLEVIGCDDPGNVQIIEDSPPPSIPPDNSHEDRMDNDDGGGGNKSYPQPLSATLGLLADYGSEQDMDDDDDDDDDEKEADKEENSEKMCLTNDDDVSELEKKKKEMEAELEGIDGEELEKEGTEGIQGEEEGDLEVNSAVIIKPPQIIVPSYVAAMNQPQLYSASALYTSATVPSSTTATAAVVPASAELDLEQGDAASLAKSSAGQTSEENEKAASKKKKKDKSGKEKSLTANSSIMMKKKRVSSMVQKWQQVKKEVEKENRDKEMKQAAIREKINQLKST